MKSNYNILILDREDYTREKMAGVLSRHPAVGMVTQISDPELLAIAARKLDPDFILIDAGLASQHKEAALIVKRLCPGARMILLGRDDGDEYRLAAARIGGCRLEMKENVFSVIDGRLEPAERSVC